MKGRIVGLSSARCATRLLFLCLGFSVLTASVASADSFTVTGGSYSETSLLGGRLSLEGDGFSLKVGTENAASMLWNCFPCTAARPQTLSFSATGGGFQSGFPGTFNDVNYASLILDGSFRIDGPSFSSALVSSNNLVFTAPFSLSSVLTAFPTSADKFNGTNPLWTNSFFGAGTATAKFIVTPSAPGEPTLFQLRSVTYEFGQGSASPTPEPATLFLFAGGLFAAARHVRRRPR